MTDPTHPSPAPGSGEYWPDLTEPLPAPTLLDDQGRPLPEPASHRSKHGQPPTPPSTPGASRVAPMAGRLPRPTRKWWVAGLVTLALVAAVSKVAAGSLETSATPSAAPASSAAAAAQPTPDAAEPTTPEPSVPAPAAKPRARPPLSVQQQARLRLNGYLAQDRTDIQSMLDDRYVVKLAAKTDGSSDSLQTTSSGSHTFRWKDVLAEHQGFRDDPRFGSTVRLLLSTQIGSGRKDPVSGRPYLITIADVGFGDAQSVWDWCKVSFPDLSEAERNNTCMPARMVRHSG